MISLLFFYFLLALSVVMFFESAGYGGFAPSVILFSWASILSYISRTPLNVIGPILTYMFLLIYVGVVFSQKFRLVIYKFIGAIHILCSILILLVNIHGKFNFNWLTFVSIISSFIVFSICALSFYVVLKTKYI